MQTIFSIHNLEADNYFQSTTACELFFYEKGNPPIDKNNRPSLMKNQHQNENVAECFYYDLKGPTGVFIPELYLTIHFSGT